MHVLKPNYVKRDEVGDEELPSNQVVSRALDTAGASQPVTNCQLMKKASEFSAKRFWLPPHFLF